MQGPEVCLLEGANIVDKTSTQVQSSINKLIRHLTHLSLNYCLGVAVAQWLSNHLSEGRGLDPSSVCECVCMLN